MRRPITVLAVLLAAAGTQATAASAEEFGRVSASANACTVTASAIWYRGLKPTIIANAASECYSFTGAPAQLATLYGNGAVVAQKGPLSLSSWGLRNGWPYFGTSFTTSPVPLRYGVTYVACTHVANAARTAWLAAVCTPGLRVPLP